MPSLRWWSTHFFSLLSQEQQVDLLRQALDAILSGRPERWCIRHPNFSGPDNYITLSEGREDEDEEWLLEMGGRPAIEPEALELLGADTAPAPKKRKPRPPPLTRE